MKVSIYVNRYEFSDTSPANDLIYVDLMATGRAVMAKVFDGRLVHLELGETSEILVKATDFGQQHREGGAQEYELVVNGQVMLDSTRLSVMSLTEHLSKSLCESSEIEKVMSLIREAHNVGPDAIQNGRIYDNWGDWK